MKIANIVSSQKVDAPQEFNIVKSIDSIIIGLPTLIIGYEYVCKNYPDFDISNLSLDKDLYWTFKKTEKRDKYTEDLNRFISKVYKDLTSSILYVFIDPIQYKRKSIIKIIKKIKSLNKIITYKYNNIMYMYGDNLLFGIDLTLLKYLDVNIDKIITKIKKISTHFLSDDSILIECKKGIEYLDNKIRYIPFLYSLKHE